jgi:hypothetical protein
MNSTEMIAYVGHQRRQIQAVLDQLDEVQVAFNARFDTFKAEHDATLDRLTALVISHLDSVSPELRSSIEMRLLEERECIDLRRQKVRDEYLPRRQQAADDLLRQAQSELAQLRALNPQLDEREEKLKAQKAAQEERLTELNRAIQEESRGIRVLTRFRSIGRHDRERQRAIGRLEEIHGALRDVRNIWQEERKKTESIQDAYQQQWQLESMAVARLLAELDQLDDPVQREDLALRRAVRHTLDGLELVIPDGDPEVQAGLEQMVELNARTDEYHEGLASVGGLIGLLRGIDSGMEAIGKSLEGLQGEESMHSAYLKSLTFSLPPEVDAFHQQWPVLAERFADEEIVGAHPVQFSTAVKPLSEGPLSQRGIEDMFDALGSVLTQATSVW